MLKFFEGRATPGVEAVSGDTYRRTLNAHGEHAIVEVRPDMSIAVTGYRKAVDKQLALV